MKISETDLGAKIVAWLASQHWEVYQEVKVNGPIADIVATQGQLLWVIECKLSLSIDLIAQAFNWKRYAHFVSIATPVSKRNSSRARYFAENLLKREGIGIINVRMDQEEITNHWRPPSINRKAMVEIIRKCLLERQKTWAPAGSPSGNAWTPFAETSRKIVRLVNKYPGIDLKTLIDKCDHHYASDKTAKACIPLWIRKDIIKGIRTEKEGKFLKFYPGPEK